MNTIYSQYKFKDYEAIKKLVDNFFMLKPEKRYEQFIGELAKILKL